MSWNWYTSKCPVCENNMDVYEDTKPFPTTSCRCRTCWFVSSNMIDRMSLKEINEDRNDEWIEPITQEEYDKYNDNSFFSCLNN